jgi:vitamin B12 transporter
MKASFQSSVLNFRFSKFIICVSLLVICHLSPVTSLFAEEKTLEEIVVTATRIEEPTAETTSDVRVIKEEDIKKMNVEFVTDVLRKIPELNLVQNGGSGQTATVFLRGGDSRHTLVMIDGVKVQNPNTGSFDFSGISVDDIERIEIVKGPQSTFYGSEAMSGVINIITKKGAGKPKVDASFESGSFGTYKPSFSISGGEESLDYRFTTEYFHTDGISSAKEGSERDGYKNAFVSGKFGIKPIEKFELEFSGRYYSDRSEFDKFDFSQKKAVDDSNFVQHGYHYVISGKGRLYLFDIWEQLLTVSIVQDSLKGRDPDPEDFFNNYDITSGIKTIEWQHNFFILDAYTITAGAEYRKERGENIGTFNESIENKALYLNNKLKLFKGDLIFDAGLRYDDHETFGDKTTYKVGALYNVKSAALRIRSSYGTGFRAPALNELFFPFYGNSSLKPEESTSWEIGLEKDLFKQRLSVSIIYFEQKYENLIQSDPSTFLAANIAEASIKGIESGAILRPIDKLEIKAGYTYLDTEDKATGQRLTRRPKDKVNLSAVFSTGKASVVANYTFVGERFDSAVERSLSSYSLVNLSGNYNVTKNIMLFGRIDNLLDEDYEEAGSYGTPGFSFFAGVKVTL